MYKVPDTFTNTICIIHLNIQPEICGTMLPRLGVSLVHIVNTVFIDDYSVLDQCYFYPRYVWIYIQRKEYVPVSQKIILLNKTEIKRK